jgi:PAS domain S-box-containing protein
MADTEGRIVLVNSQLEKYFGYERSELIGKPVEMLIPERLRHGHDAYRKRFLDERRARAMGLGRNLFGLRKDGSEFPIEIGLSPVETDHQTHILASVVDISERVQFDQELQRMRSYLKNIIDSMPSMLVGVDAEGRVTEWNQSAEQATGEHEAPQSDHQQERRKALRGRHGLSAHHQRGGRRRDPGG